MGEHRTHVISYVHTQGRHESKEDCWWVMRRQWNSLGHQLMQRAPLALDWPSVRTVKVLTGHIFEVISCAFAPDGNTLVTTSHDDTARVWCTRDYSHLHTLSGHTESVMSCTFAPNGSTLVTASEDGTRRVWSDDQI